MGGGGVSRRRRSPAQPALFEDIRAQKRVADRQTEKDVTWRLGYSDKCSGFGRRSPNTLRYPDEYNRGYDAASKEDGDA
jgi:hypothetical protein